MSRFCSVWDLHKEIQNLTLTDSLRPRNREKDSRWLLQRVNKLPGPTDIHKEAFRLSRLEYRDIWRDMAKEHMEVVSTLQAAANASTTRGHNCLFNHATKRMATFLYHFAARVEPFSGSVGDREFGILMENFGMVLDTLSIFYDCFDCDRRSETLKDERDGGRMTFFRFERNERPQPLDLSESWRRYGERYPEGLGIINMSNAREAASSPNDSELGIEPSTTTQIDSPDPQELVCQAQDSPMTPFDTGNPFSDAEYPDPLMDLPWDQNDYLYWLSAESDGNSFS